MLHKTLADLEAGDAFEPVTFKLTSLMVSEYAHGLEDTTECYYSDDSYFGKQVMPPTFIHVAKMILLEHNCDLERRVQGIRPDDARLHYEYHSQQHGPAYVGETLVISGTLADKYVKRERQFIAYDLRLATDDGRLVTTYRDKTLLRYRVAEAN